MTVFVLALSLTLTPRLQIIPDKSFIDAFSPVPSSEATGRSCFACVFQMGKEEGRFFHLWPGENKSTTVCGRETFQNPPGKEERTSLGAGAMVKQCQAPRSIPLNFC